MIYESVNTVRHVVAGSDHKSTTSVYESVNTVRHVVAGSDHKSTTNVC